MAKGQTIIWTAVPHGRADTTPDGSLRLSAVVTPQLWNTDPSVTLMHLSDFSDWLDFPAQVASMTFEAEFDGVVRPATLDPATSLRSDLWKALFDGGTQVFPYRFANDDTTGAGYLVLETSVLAEFLGKVYAEVGTDPSLGEGADLPKVVDLAGAPGVKEVARPAEPEPPYQGPPRRREPAPAPELPPRPQDRPGCVAWLIRILCWLARYIPLLRRLLGDRCRQPDTAASVPPVYHDEPVVPVPQDAPVVMPTVSVFTSDGDVPPVGPGAAAPADVSAPSSAEKAAFAASDTFFTTQASAFGALPSMFELAQKHDFHEIVSLLGDYPALLRHLGLVVDLVVSADAAIPTADTATVRVRSTWAPVISPTIRVSPRTHYVLADGVFGARPRPGASLHISNGYLDLSDPERNPVTQIDVAGSTIKYRNAATNLAAGADPSLRPSLQPEEDGLPALQTEGLAVTQAALLDVYKQSALGARALYNHVVNEENSQGVSKPDQPPVAAAEATDEVWADTLVRGYRVDVQDVKAGTWFSLHRRDSRYDFTELVGGEPVVVLDEEGFVEPSATKQPDAPSTIRIHETLFSWQGWSLSVPRPHQAIVADDTPKDPPVPVVDHLDSQPLYGLNTWYRVKKGSLPRLRYGREYRLRARVVDIAGNSVCGPEDAAFPQTPAEATSPVTFGRFEPLGPPSLMPRVAVKEGASVERMVVRSDHNTPAADMVASPDQRHVVPPRATQALAEQHAMFDTATGAISLSGTGATKDLASREAGTLTHRLDLSTNQRVQLPGAEEVVVIDADGKETGRYWIQKNAEFPLAYLPDPIAEGAQFLELPGETLGDIALEGDKPRTRVEFDGTFPDFQPFRLQIVGIPAGQAPAKPVWLPAGGGAPPVERVLVVEIPQAQTHRVRYCSYMSAESAEKMGAAEWVKRFKPGRLTKFHGNANAGRQWLLMPYRTLVLVHAVRQPLAIPKITVLGGTKDKGTGSAVGETSAILTGTLELDAASTGKVQLRAAWQDPLDDPAKPGFDPSKDVTEFTADVGEVQVGSTTNDTPTFSLTHFVKDTKFHRVRYAAFATTRFRDYFDPATPAESLIRPTPAEVAADAAAPPGAPKPTEEAKQEIDIPNSSRPAPPRIHSVIPTFRWDEEIAVSGTVTTVTRTRVGGGLRVYLERPWFSTGWGEQLGVVFAQPGQAAALPPKEREVLITHLAADPIYDPIKVPESEFTSPGEFLTWGSGGVNGAVTLAENGETVSVAGFEAAFDPVRALWYTDLEFVPPEAYFPFVRLALARYQPVSVPGAHLSPVVRADYAQLLPNRTASFTFEHQPGGTVSVSVTVNGPGFVSHFDRSRTGWAASLEHRVGPGSTGLEWELEDRMGPDAPVAGELFVAHADVPGFQPGQFRVVVREYELFPADENDPAPFGVGIDELPHGHRLVYADARVIE